MDMTSTFAPISKTAEQEDGSLLVYGKATDDSLDLDDQRCDPTWLNEAMPAWFGTGTGVGGNIRAQHRSDSAVGKAIEHEAAADGHYITARIVDRDAIAKTKAGVFTGFSIGIRRPKIVKSPTAPNGVIAGGMITEVSLCDRPANPACTLTLCKSAKPGMQVNSGDFDAERLLVKCEEYTEKTVEPDLNKADGMTVTLAEQLSPAQTEALAEKTTDVDHLEAPAPAQVCVNCGEDGHLVCGEKAADVEVPAEDVEKADADVEAEKTTDAPVKSVFDIDQAKALVAAVAGKEGTDLADAVGEVLKADAPTGAVVPPAYNDEQSDILNAQAAIAIIGKLIISEASEIVDNPAEACDIQILLSAISALRCFIGREQQQSLGENDVCDDMIVLAADVDKAETVEKAKYSAEELRDMLKAGKAMENPDGDPSYPIGDVEDLENAIHAVGRGKGDHGAIRSYIKGRAKALGKSDLIPDSWDTSKATDLDEVDATKTVEPETVKAAVFDEDAMFKALTGGLGKADSPLRKLFKSIVETSATEIVEASAKSAAEALGELGARLEKVESMATPGGPALRRTDAEIKSSRQQDLELMANAEERKASALGLDRDVRDGYLRKAAGFRAQAHAL